MRIASFLLALLLPLSATAQESPAGRWAFEMAMPGVVELERVGLVLNLDEESARLSGTLEMGAGTVPFEGRWDPETHHVSITLVRGEVRAQLELDLRDDRLVGSLAIFGQELAIEAVRGERGADGAPPIVVDFSVPRPTTVSLDGLPEELAAAISTKMRETLEARDIVGLSAAFVRDGELLDVRGFGWEDFGERIPADGETMYRWASIAKPLTAVAALQLVERGELDLDRDVRGYVPEFPEKAHPFTSRQLLCHQAGIVHYQHMGIRTLREYEVEHPWADSILRLDMFNERDLLFEPGTAYSYTTPGFVILGAVIERAGEATYVEQVQDRILRPLGMTTMQPDYEWVEIPNRARGYVRDGEGRMVDSGTDDISWKLPAGGWISTVGDLARFGIGFTGYELLEPDTLEEMWTLQSTRGGEETGSGLGIRVEHVRGVLAVSHSGGQRKASTHLVVCPDRGFAVAVMCNTQGERVSDLATDLLEMLME